jgi:hypothetical protein
MMEIVTMMVIVVMFASEYQSFETAVEDSVAACIDIACKYCAHFRVVIQ